MKELELKFLEIDVELLRAKLEASGATLNVDGVLKTVYFDNDNHDIKNSDELLRIRTFGDKVELCRKVNMRLEDGCKVYDEVETHVSDFDTTAHIFESLGYTPRMHFEKRRIEYALSDGSKFEIDIYPGAVPPFVEIEALNATRINQLAKEFDLLDYETSNLVGEELLRTKYGIELNGLIF